MTGFGALINPEFHLEWTSLLRRVFSALRTEEDNSLSFPTQTRLSPHWNRMKISIKIINFLQHKQSVEGSFRKVTCFCVGKNPDDLTVWVRLSAHYTVDADRLPLSSAKSRQRIPSRHSLSSPYSPHSPSVVIVTSRYNLPH